MCKWHCILPFSRATFIPSGRHLDIVTMAGSPEPLSYRSKVSRALKETTSVRTTVPETIARLLRAAPGSTLIWTVVPGELEARVRVDPPSLGKKQSRSA
jgi:hypothetical protein